MFGFCECCLPGNNRNKEFRCTPVGSKCEHHIIDLPYREWMEYAEENTKQKIKQVQCPHCKKWIFQNEFFKEKQY